MDLSLLSQLMAAFSPRIETKDPYFNELAQYAARVQAYALGPWQAVAKLELRCVVRAKNAPACPHPAVGKCELCKEASCLAHSAVLPNGSVVCMACLARCGKIFFEQQAKRGADAATETERAGREKDLQVLGLSPTPAPTPAEIRSAFRRAAAKWHPDKFNTASEADKNEAKARYARIEHAYQGLTNSKAAA